MTHYGQVLEDPEYYDDVDEGDWEEMEDHGTWVDLVDAAAYDPFNTINS